MGILGFLKACFAGDMLVLTRERGAVQWDELREGEEVWSQDEFDPNAAGAWKRVEEIFRTEAFIWKLRVAGQEIKTTDEHPFWVVGKGWTAAKDLRPGDRLRGHDGEPHPVESITPTDEFVPVYNARIAEYHTYYVQAPGGGVWLWAHNASCVHANRRLSRQANHLYGIYNTKGKLMKYGVSAAKINKAGQSYRAVRQISKAGGRYTTRILGHFPNRARALKHELLLTRAYQAANGGIRPPWMIRP